MKLADVLHALVNQLPDDWDLTAMHKAVDEHFDSGEKAAAPAEDEPAAPARRSRPA